MNIDNAQDLKFASSSQRAIAATIDVWIVIFIRFVFMALLGELWIKKEAVQFQEEFQLKFGGSFFRDSPEHIAFFMEHSIFNSLIIFYLAIVLAGACYYAYFHSSSWQATIGKRLMKIMIIKNNDMPTSFARGMLYYFLAILPYLYLMYIMSFLMRYDITIAQAITANFANIFFTIVFFIWIQSHFITKRKTTIYDIICHITVVEGKVNKKFPWHK